MIPDHGTKYEETPPSHHGRMYEDRQTDCACSYIPRLCSAESGNKLQVLERGEVTASTSSQKENSTIKFYFMP